MKNLYLSIFFILVVSFNSQADHLSNCNELFTTGNKNTNLISVTFKNLEEEAVFHLKRNQINYKSSIIDGHKAFIIQPHGDHPLNKYAAMLQSKFEHTLAISPELTTRKDSALYAFDLETLFTSVKDIEMNKVGAATRHETVHLMTNISEQIGEIHPVYHASLRSKAQQDIFNSAGMEGYEQYISFDEIKAYATELQYSLKQLESGVLNSQEQIIKTQEDILEAQMRLKSITTNIRQYIEKLNRHHESLVISSEEAYHYISLDEIELTIPKQTNNVKTDLKRLLDELRIIEKLSLSELLKR